MRKTFDNGNIVLICGDCNEEIKKLKKNSVDFPFFDPPYKMEIHGRGFASKRAYYKNLDYGTSKEFELTKDFMKEINRVSTRKSFVSFCDKMLKFDLMKYAVSKKWSFDELVICKKAPAPLTNNQWLPDKEFAVHVFNKAPVFGNYRTKTSFFVVDNLREPNVEHPSVKPQHILCHIINNLSQEGETVFDPYMGSGSTGVACIKTNRKFVGVERNPKYFDLSCERIEDELYEKRNRLI